MSFKFLRQTGEFANVSPADIISSTTTTTGFLTFVTASTTVNISLGTTSTYVDGPSVTQGTSGTWFATGTLSIVTGGTPSVSYLAKLWDGTTAIDATAVFASVVGNIYSLSLSGVISSPSGNLRISALPNVASNGTIVFNNTGTSRDSTITAIRIG